MERKPETDEEKIKSYVATSALNNLNLQGIIEASKSYCISFANKRYESLTEEERKEILIQFEAAEEEQKNTEEI